MRLTSELTIKQFFKVVNMNYCGHEIFMDMDVAEKLDGLLSERIKSDGLTLNHLDVQQQEIGNLSGEDIFRR